jgi:predicted HD phosphohydrolase
MIFNDTNMAPIFSLMERLNGVLNNPEHHPEEDMFIHSLQVMELAFKETNDTCLILAAMVHDVGKYDTVTCDVYDHETFSVLHIQHLDLISPKVIWLVENHMRIYKYLRGEMKRYGKRIALLEHPWFIDLIQLSRWDEGGRIKNWIPPYNRKVIIERLNKKVCDKYE